MQRRAAIILAAGLGTRMRSRTAKVLHPICGEPMVAYPLALARELGCHPILLVVGHQADEVKAAVSAPDVIFIQQAEQLGTGHAVLCGEEALAGFSGDVVILCGDVPLARASTLERLLQAHAQAQATVSVLTMTLPDPTGYGRVLRGPEGRVLRIVEEKDATPQERQVREVNSGLYAVRAEFLFRTLKQSTAKNAQGEYYLTDLIALAPEGAVVALQAEEAWELMGINTRADLARASALVNRALIEGHMAAGVTFLAPEATYVERLVRIGEDTVIHPHCYLAGRTVIGRACVIEPGVKLVDSVLADEVHVKPSCLIEASRLGRRVTVGPFAHLRPGTVIEDEARIGNFVEVKQSRIGRGTKANHLSYIGDADVGSGVNIGAGTITCNYDGQEKHETVIKDGAFIGSDSQLVAPVTVGEEAYVASGSTITEDVPPGALAVARSRQVNKEGWVARKGPRARIARTRREDGAAKQGPQGTVARSTPQARAARKGPRTRAAGKKRPVTRP